MFPSKSVTFLQNQLTRRGRGDLQGLIEELLLRPGSEEEEDYIVAGAGAGGGVEESRPGSSRDSEGEQVGNT